MMIRTGEILCDAVDAVADFVDAPALADRWAEGSALDGYTIGALAGHVTSAASATLRYLGTPGNTEGEPVDRGDYYAAVPSPAESPELHARIRNRGQAIADDGPQTVATMLRECAHELRAGLAGRKPDDLITVMGGHARSCPAEWCKSAPS